MRTVRCQGQELDVVACVCGACLFYCEIEVVVLFGVVSVWTNKKYVFRAVLGGLVAQMRMGDAPGGWKPGKTELFTPKFTPNGLF